MPTGLLGERSRWLGEVGRGPQGWRGALEAEEEGVDDLCVSVLATWELCLPAPADRKRNFWKCIQGEDMLLGSGSIWDSEWGRGEGKRKRVCVYIKTWGDAERERVY